MTHQESTSLTRFTIFRDAIAGIAGSRPVRWSSYTSAYSIKDGSVDYFPEIDESGDDPVREGLDRLIDYSRFLLGQGFTVEIGIVPDEEGVFFHIVSWEGDEEPYWPSSFNFFAVLRNTTR